MTYVMMNNSYDDGAGEIRWKSGSGRQKKGRPDYYPAGWGGGY
jgi:hypothetical protein